MADNATPSRYVESWNDGWLESAADLDGIDWSDAPAPPRLHRCWAQTIAYVDREQIARCPCGATRYGIGPWEHRNRRNTSLVRCILRRKAGA